MNSFICRARAWIFILIPATTLAFLNVGGCNGQDQESDKDNDVQTLGRGINGDPESLDPSTFSSNQSAAILRDIGEGLVSYSKAGEIVPGVAESWEVSPDGKSYNFKLRESARWSNGVRITATDFITAFKRLVDPESDANHAYYLDYIKNASAIRSGALPTSELGVFSEDSNSLRIELELPTPFFLQVLAHPSTFPVYSSDPAVTSYVDVFNGAYLLEFRIIGSEVALVKNRSYWDADSVRVERVVYHVVQDSAELNRFRTGELDITANVATSIFGVAAEEFPDQLRVTPSLGVYYYGFNWRNSKFASNRDLRIALSLAIDRRQLVENVIGRGEQPAFSWVPPGTADYVPVTYELLARPRSEREAAAIASYAKAGYSVDNPLTIQIRYNTSDVQRRIALAVQSMWRDVLGVNAELVNEEFGVLLSNIREAEETEVFRLSWTADFNHPDAFLKIFESDNPSNLTRFSNDRFDALIQSAREESDEERRLEILRAAESIILEQHPVIPLYFYVNKHLVRSTIDGWQDNPMDIHLSKYFRIREQ